MTKIKDLWQKRRTKNKELQQILSAENPKYEYRNPRQIQKRKFKMRKTKQIQKTRNVRIYKEVG
jgi:hypothetical protein